ncbi:MAG: helix-turn-helix domain-containing protein [Chitinophagales bacterium]|jgi:AraC-like DNA-binding protein
MEEKDQIETLESFYKRKMDGPPASFGEGMGHFNVFRLEPFVGEQAQPVPYERREFYKIMLVYGEGSVHFADRMVHVRERALTFSAPSIPYYWEHTQLVTGGVFCIFNALFFNQFGNINQYSVFQPEGNHVFELSEEEAVLIEQIFSRMMDELASEYAHKQDVMRNLVFELLHFATKKDPAAVYVRQPMNASHRISTLFLELLERQFPVDPSPPRVRLRSASDFARQLNIHVNHLNRAVKTTTQMTTSQLIASRTLQEAKVLLRNSSWTVSEIAYALGYEEVTHFNQFFKKHLLMSPLKYRNSSLLD